MSEKPDGEEGGHAADVGVAHRLGGGGADVDAVPGEGRAADQREEDQPRNERTGRLDHDAVRCQKADHRHSADSIDENEKDSYAHTPGEGVPYGLSDLIDLPRADIFPRQRLAGEGESICEIGEYKKKFQHYRTGCQQHVSETGGDGGERQIDYYQAGRTDEQVSVDGEKPLDPVTVKSGLEVYQ